MAKMFVDRWFYLLPQDAIRAFAIAGFAALLLAMAGCAGPSGVGSAANVTGDQQGGKVPYAEGQMQTAMNAAQAHCGQFGKKAQIVQMVPAAEGGGTVGFQCR